MGGRIGRLTWYLCGAILVLSLPTFSYLVPKTELVLGPQRGVAAAEKSGSTTSLHSESSHQSISDPVMRSSSFITSGAVLGKPAPTRSSPVERVKPADVLARRQSSGPAASSTRSSDRSRLGENLPDAIAGRSQAANLAGGSPSRLGGGRYAQELSSFEQGYQAAAAELFNNYPLGFRNWVTNPFDDALPDDPPKDGDSPDPGNNGDNKPGDNGNGGSQTPDPPPNDPELPPDDPLPPPIKRYSMLVAGEFEGAGSKNRVFRSYRNEQGRYVLENGGVVDLFSGVVGVPQIQLAGDQQLVVDDLDGDGRNDLLVTSRATQGTVFEVYFRDSRNTRPDIGTMFLWKSVVAIGLLDFNADGRLDIAVLFRNTPNLFVYTISEDNKFDYLKEIVLPFEPSLMVDSHFESLTGERRLVFFDASFRRIATLTSRNPGVFLLGLPTSQTFRSFKLDAEEDGPGATEVRVFENDRGIAFFEKKLGGWTAIASFSTSVRFPIVVFGDHQNVGTRQLLCLP